MEEEPKLQIAVAWRAFFADSNAALPSCHNRFFSHWGNIVLSLRNADSVQRMRTKECFSQAKAWVVPKKVKRF